jgi:hypothetical protein
MPSSEKVASGILSFLSIEASSLPSRCTENNLWRSFWRIIATVMKSRGSVERLRRTLEASLCRSIPGMNTTFGNFGEVDLPTHALPKYQVLVITHSFAFARRTDASCAIRANCLSRTRD